MSQCATVDCSERGEIEIGNSGMRVCRPCEFLMDHPEIDCPKEIERVYQRLS